MPVPADDKKSTLAFKTEVRFLGKDHVGSVRHFEGVSVREFAEKAREIMYSMSPHFTDALETPEGHEMYTCVGEDAGGGELIIWVKGTQVEGVGVVADVKVMHSTEDSAVADELLVSFMEGLGKELTG